jgi:hypothetical protein
VSSFFLALSFIVLSLSVAGLAQELAATLTGTVTDPSGAVVAGATVLVHYEDTGADVRTVSTSGTGNFNITNLPAGRYTVTVNSSGFQTFVAKGVILNVAEKHTLNVQLSAGKVSERVEVTAENTAIQTTTAEESGTVTGEQVRELALNNRNFEQLVLLQPGVANQLPDKVGFGLQNNTVISINGARDGANNWTVDGGDINDSGSNGTLLNTPGIDAIQEFTLERSNYDAAFGRSGGGQIVVATKSGTNDFHGSAYEFNRNNFYNANTFGDREVIALGEGTWDTNKTPIERYNDYGFTIGGPLFIPKVFHPAKDKTFFFWSEEWRKSSLPQTNQITVPSAGQLGGAFPWVLDSTQGTPNYGLYVNPIYQAAWSTLPTGCVTSTAPVTTNPNGSPYAQTSTTAQTSTINLTTAGCASQNAMAYMNAFMANNPPNAAGNQLITPYSSLDNFRQDIIRLDQNVGDKVRIYARYMEDVVPQNFPYSLWGGANYPGVETTAVNAPGRNLVINGTVNINPRVVNEVEFVDAWGAINATLSAIVNSPSFTSKLTNNTKYQDPYGRAPNVSITGYTGLGTGSGPYFERNIDRTIFDNLSIQHGNHTIRVGFTSMWMQKTENASSGEASFSFSNVNGNDGFANFLLGQADSYSQPNKDTIPHLRYTNFEMYVQDDWKVTPRLTLNLGVRYSYFPSPTDSNNTLLNFDPLLYSASVGQALQIGPNDGNMDAPNADAATYANGLIFPKGDACSAAQAVGPLVTCSPYGSRVNPSSNKNFGPRIGIAYDPFGNGKWAVRGGFGIFYDRTLNGIWEQNAFGDPPLVQTTVENNVSNSINNLFDAPLTAGTAGALPISPVSLTTTGTPAFKVPSYMDYNLSLQHEIMANTMAEIGFVGTRGTHLLGDIDLNQPTVTTRLANPEVYVNAIAPSLGYSGINSRAPIYTSNYNSLQVSLNRRMSKGLTMGLAYTWSKLLTTNPWDRGLAAYDTYDLKSSYGPSELNTPQMFVLNYVYDLPFYQNQRGLAGHVLGGWELSGIVTIQSGQSQYITQANDPWTLVNVANNGTTPYCTTPPCPMYPGGLGMGPSSIAIRADQIGDPHGPKSVLEYFNTAAFTQAVGHFGSSRPGAILGPGYQIWDLSAFKNVKLAERLGLQLRLDAFNAFNHGNPSSIDTGVNDGASYGTVNGWHDPRTLQLGVKIKF